jgi:hypothetical protein
MGVLFSIIPILQAISALFSLWGFAHLGGTTEAVITYGASEVSPQEWINSYGSLALGVVGWVTTHFVNKRQPSSTSELIASFVAWAANRNDPATRRRLALAAIDTLETLFVFSDKADSEYFQQTLVWLRSHYASSTSVQPNINQNHL